MLFALGEVSLVPRGIVLLRGEEERAGAHGGAGEWDCRSPTASSRPTTGRMVVDSEEGKDATFTIFLPAAARAAHLL
jgi:hypothetical protein